MVADDPDSILSYGLLSKMLIEKWKDEYDIHYLSLQYPMGNPIQRDGYIKYPAHNQGERNPTYLQGLLPQLRPDILWTNFDIQHYENVKRYVPPGATWVGWCPWDNHDVDQVRRAQSSFEKVDTRVAISQFGYNFLNKNGVRMDNWVYNMVDDVYKPMPDNHPDIIDFKKKNSKWYKEGMRLLVFVGRPNWRKRMLHLFAIIKELVSRGHKNVRLFLHSNLDDPAKTANLRELIDALQIKDYIINSQFFWDMGVPKEDLRIIYNMADLYIAPHGGEGFGMPIVESMACGTPFVATDICTTPEFCGKNFERGLPAPVAYPVDGQNRVVKDKGVARPYPIVNKFTDVIESLLYDDKRLRMMGVNGAKWAKENCSQDVVAKKWSSILDEYIINYAQTEGYKK